MKDLTYQRVPHFLTTIGNEGISERQHGTVRLENWLWVQIQALPLTGSVSMDKVHNSLCALFFLIIVLPHGVVMKL